MKLIFAILLAILVGVIISNCGPTQPVSVTPGLIACTVTQGTVGSTVTCPDGSTAFIPAGTIITPIQFCPGQPSYPSAFPEYGLCISGQLYGVYSANDGFLALLPPGNYYSNGIGSSCDFTIGPNCVITAN